MKISAFFNLIRWKNLVLIFLMQIFIKYFLLSNFGFQTALSDVLFFLLVILTLLITASGYIINDIIDLKGDIINKPSKVIIQKIIPKSHALTLYRIIALLGIFIGVYLSFKINKPIYSFYFIGIAALLYYYSKYLKGKVIVGNLVVSFLLAFSILIILLFDYPISMNSMQWSVYFNIQAVIYLYALFAFLLNFIREIIKDIEDVDGDYNQSYRTLPILIGKKRARNIAIAISFFTLFFLIYIHVNFVNTLSVILYYDILFVIIPIIYFIYKLWDAKTLKNYNQLSNVLKIIILFGIISIPLISIYIQNAFN